MLVDGPSGVLGALEASVDAGADMAAMPLSDLVLALGQGLDRLDEGFARTFARSLAERAAHVRLPVVDGLGLDDVVATLYMDGSLRLVVTGTLRGGPGAVSVRFDEGDFDEVRVELHREPVPDPYTFATLDFSWRGKSGWLRVAAPPLPAGQKVSIRALATIGERTEFRVAGLGIERSVAPEDLALDESEL